MYSLKFTNAEAIQYADVVKGVFSFRVRVPTPPTVGHLREFGLKSLNKGSGIFFQVDGEDFNAVVVDGDSSGSGEIYLPLTWETGVFDSLVPNTYTIQWEAGMAKFFINDTHVATLPFSDYDIMLASTPMSIYVKNESGSDDLYVDYIEGKGIQSYL